MKINKNLIISENGFLPTTASQLYLIRILFERLDKLNENNELNITFKEIRELFGTDIRQKFINDILDKILVSTFTYEGKVYKYIDSYVNHYNKRSYTITFPADTVKVWLEDAIEYDFDTIRVLKSNKSSIVLYEYFRTGNAVLSFDKFCDIFNKDGYDFYDKKRELSKSVNNINNKSDIRVEVVYQRENNLFNIRYIKGGN